MGCDDILMVGRGEGREGGRGGFGGGRGGRWRAGGGERPLLRFGVGVVRVFSVVSGSPRRHDDA